MSDYQCKTTEIIGLEVKYVVYQHFQIEPALEVFDSVFKIKKTAETRKKKKQIKEISFLKTLEHKANKATWNMQKDMMGYGTWQCHN